MRRSDREVQDPKKVIEILNKCKICRLAFFDGKEPYVIPLTFGFEFEGDKLKLFIHCAREGRKIDILKAGFTKVAFEMDCDTHLVINREVPCASGYAYESLTGVGQMNFLEGNNKRRALECIFQHQAEYLIDIPENLLVALEVCVLQVENFVAKVCLK